MPIKIFSHRGSVIKKSQENKIEAFKNVYKKGIRAIEFDIWYLKNQLVLKHNRPITLNNLDRLEDLFISFGIENRCSYVNTKKVNPIWHIQRWQSCFF